MLHWKDQLLCFLETTRLKNMFHCSTKTKYPQLYKVTEVRNCHPCLSEKAKYILLIWSVCFYFTCDVEHVILGFHNSYRSFPDLKRKKKSTDATLMVIQQTSFMFAREITVTSMWWVQQQIKPQIRDVQPQSYRNCIENSGLYQQENFRKLVMPSSIQIVEFSFTQLRNSRHITTEKASTGKHFHPVLTFSKSHFLECYTKLLSPHCCL